MVMANGFAAPLGSSPGRFLGSLLGIATTLAVSAPEEAEGASQAWCTSLDIRLECRRSGRPFNGFPLP